MKKHLPKTILFITFILGVYILLYHFSVYTANIFNDGASIICKSKREMVRKNIYPDPPGKKHVIFLGNSISLAGLIPSYFDSLNGNRTSSLNLSLPALSIGPQYFMFKEYLEQGNHPDFIILFLSLNLGEAMNYFDKYAIQGIDFPDEVFSYLVHRKNKSVIINYVFPMNLYCPHMVKYFYYLTRSPDRIKSRRLTNDLNREKMILQKGYFFIQEQARFPSLQLPDSFSEGLTPAKEPPDFDPFSDYYTEKFFHLALKYHIRVLLVQSYARVNAIKQYAEVPRQFSLLKSTYPNVYFADDGYKIKFCPNRYFSDLTHVNPSGARIYTNQISVEFNEVFKGLY